MANKVTLGILEERVKNHIWFFVAAVTGGVLWLGWLTHEISEMNKTISGLESIIKTPQRLVQAAEQPERPENQAAAKQVIAEAKEKSIHIPADVLEATGKSFINAAQQEANAWDVALQFLNYRSSRPIFKLDVYGIKPPSPTVMLHYNAGPLVPGKPPPHLERLTRAYVASHEAARYESIGENLNQAGGVPGILVKGGAVSLDTKDIKNVIFLGVEVYYTGKPLILQNAVFVNCKFFLENTEPSRKLGTQLLASSEAVNFKNAA